MKKLIPTLLIAALALALLAACGDMDSTAPQSGSGQKNDNAGGGKSPADKVADGASDVAHGVANAVDDVWDGLSDMLDGDSLMEDDGEGFKAYGIDEGLLDDYALYRGKDAGDPREVFIARVGQGNLDKVEKALEARRSAVAQQWKDSTDAALAYAKEPVILKNGDYIILAVHDKAGQLKTAFEKLTK